MQGKSILLNVNKLLIMFILCNKCRNTKVSTFFDEFEQNDAVSKSDIIIIRYPKVFVVVTYLHFDSTYCRTLFQTVPILAVNVKPLKYFRAAEVRHPSCLCHFSSQRGCLLQQFYCPFILIFFCYLLKYLKKNGYLTFLKRKSRN